MQTELLTFTQHYTDLVNTRFGTKTKNTFVTADGRRFETFNAGIAAQAAAALNRPIKVTYEVRVNGQFTNLDIKGVDAGNGAPAPQPTVDLGGVAQAYTQAIATPATETNDERQLRIMRQSAIERVALFVGAGIIEAPATLEEAFAAADDFIDYFVNGNRAPQAAGPVA